MRESLDSPELEDPFAPEGDEPTAVERRVVDRLDTRQPLRYRFCGAPGAGGTWSQGLVLNLSESGGSFLVDGAWDIFDAERAMFVDLELRLDRDSPALRVSGRVVWVKPDGGAEGIDRIGVRFTDMSAGDRERLHTFLCEAA
jgi:Tfp pilus assembly protein PilZ